MLVCWLIPEMPLSWKVERGVIVAPVGHVPTELQQDYSLLHPEGNTVMWAVRVHTERPAGMGPITALPPPIHNRDVNRKTDLGSGRKGSVIMWWWQVYWSIMRLLSRRHQIDSHARRVKACVRAGLGPSRYKHEECEENVSLLCMRHWCRAWLRKLVTAHRQDEMIHWKCRFQNMRFKFGLSGAERSFSHNVHQSRLVNVCVEN